MNTYRVHFPQQNEIWIEVEATNAVIAASKSLPKRAAMFPFPDCIEYPDGRQETLSGD